MNKKLVQIARRYQQTCNRSYNRVCTGLDRRGNKVPANALEAARVKYERKFELEWIKALESFKPNGFKRGEINKAIKEYLIK